MEFLYRGRTSEGELQQGRIAAGTVDEAAALLLGKGLTPISVEQAVERFDPMRALEDWLESHARISAEELIVFCRQMYALSRAGIPIVRAMRGLSESSGSKKLRQTIAAIARELESGKNLATCLGDHRDVFSPLFIAMIHVGENTGSLDQAFYRLAQNLELEQQARKRAQQAVRYPVMVIGALLLALIVINFWVIPAFAGVFERLGSDLPLPTRILMSTSAFLLAYWWLVLGLAVAAALAVRQWLATEAGRLAWDRRKLGIPLVGRLLERLALSRFARNFSMMLAAGLPITQALTLVAGALGNAHLAQAVGGMRSGIERGETLVGIAGRAGIFSPLVMQMLSVGEETGQVETLLEDVADFYDQEIEYDLVKLSESIEPLLILMMGVLVLILALGVFLPIWSLSEAAMSR